MKMRTIAALAIAMTFSAMGVTASERTWTRSEILAITDAKAKELGYDVEQMSVSFDAYNSVWNSASRDYPLENGDMNQEFWAVLYAPLPSPVKGGDLWVLVGKESGKVLQTLQGK